MKLRVETSRPTDDTPIIELWQIGKLSVLAYIVLSLQASVMGHFQTSWCHLDLTPMVIALVGLRLGAMPGAIFGTTLGWFSVLLLGEPSGLPVLVGLAVGALAGRARDELMVDLWPVRFATVFVFTAAAEVAIAAGSAPLLGHPFALSPLTFAVALPFIPVVDWLVRVFTREA